MSHSSPTKSKECGPSVSFPPRKARSEVHAASGPSPVVRGARAVGVADGERMGVDGAGGGVDGEGEGRQGGGLSPPCQLLSRFLLGSGWSVDDCGGDGGSRRRVLPITPSPRLLDDSRALLPRLFLRPPHRRDGRSRTTTAGGGLHHRRWQAHRQPQAPAAGFLASASATPPWEHDRAGEEAVPTEKQCGRRHRHRSPHVGGSGAQGGGRLSGAPTLRPPTSGRSRRRRPCAPSGAPTSPRAAVAAGAATGPQTVRHRRRRCRCRCHHRRFRRCGHRRCRQRRYHRGWTRQGWPLPSLLPPPPSRRRPRGAAGRRIPPVPLPDRHPPGAKLWSAARSPPPPPASPEARARRAVPTAYRGDSGPEPRAKGQQDAVRGGSCAPERPV